MIHLPPAMVSSLPARSQNLISACFIGPLLDGLLQKEILRKSLELTYLLEMKSYKGWMKKQDQVEKFECDGKPKS